MYSSASSSWIALGIHSLFFQCVFSGFHLSSDHLWNRCSFFEFSRSDPPAVYPLVSIFSAECFHLLFLGFLSNRGCSACFFCRFDDDSSLPPSVPAHLVIPDTFFFLLASVRRVLAELGCFHLVAIASTFILHVPEVEEPAGQMEETHPEDTRESSLYPWENVHITHHPRERA